MWDITMQQKWLMKILGQDAVIYDKSRHWEWLVCGYINKYTFWHDRKPMSVSPSILTSPALRTSYTRLVLGTRCCLHVWHLTPAMDMLIWPLSWKNIAMDTAEKIQWCTQSLLKKPDIPTDSEDSLAVRGRGFRMVLRTSRASIGG